MQPAISMCLYGQCASWFTPIAIVCDVLAPRTNAASSHIPLPPVLSLALARYVVVISTACARYTPDAPRWPADVGVRGSVLALACTVPGTLTADGA